LHERSLECKSLDKHSELNIAGSRIEHAGNCFINGFDLLGRRWGRGIKINAASFGKKLLCIDSSDSQECDTTEQTNFL
jgi:hypothetical protein